MEETLEMTVDELLKNAQAYTDSIIEFGKDVSEISEDFEAGMRARIVSISEDLKDPDIVLLSVEYSEFDAYNTPLMTASYYDENNDPVLRWKDTGFYRGQDTLYLTKGYTVPIYVLSSTKLFDMFLALQESGETRTYTQWLEDELSERLGLKTTTKPKHRL